MQQFASILIQVILPIFVLIGFGVVLKRKLDLNVKTLSDLNIYLFVPGIIFNKLYETRFSTELIGTISLFLLLYIALLYVSAIGLNRLLRHDKPMRTAFSNSIIFYNSGNYGVPVNDLVFRGDPFAMSIQILILSFQNIFTFSYGIIVLQSVQRFQIKVLLQYFTTPVFFAMAFGILFNMLNVPLPSFVMVPSRYIAEGLVAIALITLGAQVAYLKITRIYFSVLASLLLRLVLGPVLALGIIFLMKLDGVVAYALLISSAMPTSVNSSIIAQVYNNEPKYASEVVLMSTLLSALTVSLTIYFGGYLL